MKELTNKIFPYGKMTLCTVALLILVLTASVVIVPDSANAQSISISPNRVIFDGRKNKDRVLVSNPSDKPRTYRVKLLKRRMTEHGKYVDVKAGDEQPDELFADEVLRVSPRSFTLEPRSSQTVRLRLRKKKDLPEGEYRSHLRIQVLPETSAPSIVTPGKIGINIRVNYGITIPIIVRNGELTYKANVADIELLKDNKTGRDILRTTLTRDGLRSSYGDISVIFTDQSGKEHLLKFMPGLSLFYPNKSRIFTIPLDTPPGLELSKGILKVIYREQEVEGAKVIAEGTKSL